MFGFSRWLRQTFCRPVHTSRRVVFRRSLSTRLRLEQLEDRLAPAVTVIENFAGMSGGFSSTNNRNSPPDTILATDPNEVVEAVNTSLIVKDKAGNTLVPETQFSSLFSSVATPGDAYSDPYVLYDAVHSRFVIGILEFANTASPSTADLDFAVSKTSDPATGGWNIFQKITKVEENNTFPDFPKWGSNADAVYVSFNQYASVTATDSSHNQILTVPWTSILGTANGGTLSGLFQTDIPTASDWNILIPARMDDTANGSVAGGPEYYVASDIVDGSSTTTASDITVYKETNVLSAAPTFTSTKINVNQYDASPGIAGLTSLVDSRMLSVDVNNGKLVAAGNVGLSDGLNHARWYELDVSGSAPTLLQQGDISPGSGLDTSYPGIAIDLSGNIGMTFVQSGNPASGLNWQTPSMYITAHRTTDAANFMETPIEIKAGVLGATSQGQRGGDYSATVFDPTSDSFWSANEFTDDALSTDDWGTQIAQFTANAWTSIGPAPIDKGQIPGGGLVSGRITGLAADPKDANTVYIATAGGGIWKSTNADAANPTWTALTDNLFDNNGNPIPEFMGAVAETDATSGTFKGNQIVYAGTGEANNALDSFYGEGILVSKDGGVTWTLTSGPTVFSPALNANVPAFTLESVSKIVIDPSDPTGGTAYAAMSDFASDSYPSGFAPQQTGTWKTTNFGATWTNTTAAAPNNLSTFTPWSDVVIDPKTPTTLFAAEGNDSGSTGNGIYESTNGGGLWARTGSLTLPSGNSAGRISLAISHPAAASGATLYASISQPSFNGGVLKLEKSTDSGATWTDVTGNLNGDNYLGTQGGYDNVVAISPTNTSMVFAAGVLHNQGPTFSGGGIVETQDGGSTWTDGTHLPDINTGTAGNNGPHTDYHALTFDANGHLIVGNDGGVWRLDSNDLTTPNIAWTNLNGNLNITQFTGVGVDPTNGDVYGGSQDNGTVKYTGTTNWSNIFLGDGGITRVDPTNHNRVYAERNDLSLALSTDGGSTFNFITTGIASNKVNFYAPYVPDSSGDIYYGTDFLNFSSNQGSSWSQIGTPGTNNFNPNDDAIEAVAVSSVNKNVVYVAANDSQFNSASGGHMFVTKNAQTSHTWTEIDLPGGVGAGASNSIAVDPSDPTGGTAYAVVNAFTGSGKHVFKTTNFGAKWTDISGNLPDTPVDSVTVSPDGKTVWVGTDVGVYDTTDGGTTWNLFGTGLPNAQVVELEDVPSLNLLVVGTHGRGAWELSTLTVTAPSITTNPSNQTVTAFNPATFTAAASGNPAPTVQWQDSTDGGKTWNNISGATSTTLTLTSVLFALNDNEYRAVFTNSAGSATTNAATLKVTAANVTTTANSATAVYSPNAQSLQLSATVTDTSLPPQTVGEGTVNFTVTDSKGNTIGTAQGTVSSGKASGTLNLSAGQAAGSYTIAVSYTDSAGNFTDNGDTSAALTINAAKVTTAAGNVTAVYSPNTQSLQLSATLSDTSITTDKVTEGTVNFTVTDSKGNTIGTSQGTVSNGAANATLNLSAGQAADSYTIAVSYTDSAGNFTDNGDTTGTLTISAANVTTTAGSVAAVYSPNAQKLSLSATLADTSITTDTVTAGTVNFTVTDSKGNTIGTAQGTVSNGKTSGTLNLSAGQAAGSYTIAVGYTDSAGNFTDNGDTSGTLTVKPASATTTASNVTAVYSPNAQTLSLSATLTDTSIATDTVTEGTVTFTVKNGTTTIGTTPGNVTGGTAKANFNLPAGLNAGSYTIAVSYIDSAGNFIDSGDTSGTLTVKPASATTTAASTSTTYSTGGQTVALSASIADPGPAVSVVGEGAVTFTIKHGSTVFGSVQGTVTGGTAHANLNLPGGMNAGVYAIAVSYSDSQGNWIDNGDTNGLLTIGKAPTNIQLTAATLSPNFLNLTVTETLTVHVGSSTSITSGIVTFTASNQTASANVDGNGNATVRLTVPMSSLLAPQDISINYADPANNFASSSNAQTESGQLLSVFLPSLMTFSPNGEVEMANLFGLLVTFTNGRLAEIDFGSIHIVFSYDASNQLTQVTWDGINLLP